METELGVKTCEETFFSNMLNESEENFPLSKIIKKDIKIKVIKFLCLYKKIVKEDGFWGFWGYTKEIWESKNIIVRDSEGIDLYFDDKSCNAFFNFSSKEEFEKISEEKCDIKTLHKLDTEAIFHRYQVNFLIGNLKGLGWE